MKRGGKAMCNGGEAAAALLRGEDYSSLSSFCFFSELGGSGCFPEAVAKGSGFSK